MDFLDVFLILFLFTNCLQFFSKCLLQLSEYSLGLNVDLRHPDFMDLDRKIEDGRGGYPCQPLWRGRQKFREKKEEFK